MVYKVLRHKLGIGLVVAGLLLPAAPRVLAQADEPNDQPVTGVVHPVAVGNEMDTASHHVFLPLVQTDVVNPVRGADLPLPAYCKRQAPNETVMLWAGTLSGLSNEGVYRNARATGCPDRILDNQVPTMPMQNWANILNHLAGAPRARFVGRFSI